MTTLKDSAVAYAALEVEDTLQPPALMNEFKWLDKWMLYFLCVPRKVNGEYRSKSFRISILTIQIIMILFQIPWLAYDVVLMFEAATDYQLYYVSVWIVYVSSFVILRFLSLYYFYFKFQYPWRRISHKMAKENSKYIAVTIVLYVAAHFTCDIVYSIAWPLSYHIRWYYHPLFIFCIFVLGPPVWFMMVIQFIIASKYKQYLSVLINSIQIDLKHTDFQDIFDEYKMISKEFKKEYSWVIIYSAHLILAPGLIVIWINVWQAQSGGIGGRYMSTAGLLFNYISLSMNIAVFVMAGCYLNETSRSLQKALWKYIEETEIETNNQSLLITTLLSYTKDHPIEIKFLKIRVTRRGTLLFVMGYIMSRVVSKYVSYFN